MKPRFRGSLRVTILIVCYVLNGINSDEIVIDFDVNMNNYRTSLAGHSNEIGSDTIEEIYQQRLLEEITKKEEEVKKVVFRIPELRKMWPLFKFGGYQGKPSTNSTNSTQCNTDLRNLGSSLTQQWIIPLIDSYGKPPSGFMKGNLFWTGNYDECVTFEAPKTILFPSGFEGKYCVASIAIKNSSTSIRTAICVPNSCNSADLNNDFYGIASYLKKIPIVKNYVKDLPEIQVNCLPKGARLNTASIVFILVLSIFTALSLAGTGYDIYVRFYPLLTTSEHDKSTEELTNGESSLENDTEPILDKEQDTVVRTNKIWIEEVAMCFSLLKNGEYILDTSIKPGQLNCVHGIRFISMTWVILGHTYAFGLMQFGNVTDILAQFNNWPFMAIVGGQFSVDTFFLLSGFLLSYLFLKERDTFTLKRLGVLYTHRYIRLTPVYMMVVFAFATLYNFMGDGPYWPYADQDSNTCTKYWWRNILYINNLFKSSEDCAGWSWYLANDMQFFIISPLFLVFMKSQRRKFRYAGLAILLVLLLTSWVTTMVIVAVNKISAELTGNALVVDDMFENIYVKPWTRIGPYLIGCLLGFIIVEFKGDRNLLNRIWIIVLWMAAIALGLVDVYGIYKANFDLTTNVFYYSLSRSAWAIAVSWVIFACLTGHGGPVDKFLSWKLFFPLGRLTYCAYLVHPIVMFYYYQNLRSPVMVNNTFIAIHYLGFIVLSYGLAFITSLVFESPVIRLEKFLRDGVKP